MNIFISFIVFLLHLYICYLSTKKFHFFYYIYTHAISLHKKERILLLLFAISLHKKFYRFSIHMLSGCKTRENIFISFIVFLLHLYIRYLSTKKFHFFYYIYTYANCTIFKYRTTKFCPHPFMNQF